MNREILFRGKRIENGEWVYGSLVLWYDGSISIETGNIHDNYEFLEGE